VGHLCLREVSLAQGGWHLPLCHLYPPPPTCVGVWRAASFSRHKFYLPASAVNSFFHKSTIAMLTSTCRKADFMRRKGKEELLPSLLPIPGTPVFLPYSHTFWDLELPLAISLLLSSSFTPFLLPVPAIL